MIAIYGAIWVLWYAINRFICHELIFMDSILNFCQITGCLNDFGLNWPGRSRALDYLHTPVWAATQPNPPIEACRSVAHVGAGLSVY